MGKGDRKTRRGKLFLGSFGVRRRKKKTLTAKYDKPSVKIEEKAKIASVENKKPVEEKKETAKKPAAEEKKTKATGQKVEAKASKGATVAAKPKAKKATESKKDEE